MPTTYAVTWRNPDGHQFSGRLSLSGHTLHLEGRNERAGSEETLDWGDIAGLRMARQALERIDGRQTLVLELRADGSIRIADVGQPGALAELAERLGTLAA
jgi:hypothetical protein